MRLEGKIAAITGAGRGIGRAAAELFAREGARLAILEMDPKTGKEAEDAIQAEGREARWFQVDISDPVQVERTFAQVEKVFGGLQVLYNNASVFLNKKDARVTDLPVDIWQKVIAINLSGLFYCCKFALPLMIKSGGGSIINTSSSAGLIGIPNCDAYTASKGGTITLTRSLAVEYGRQGIRANCIAPAGIMTPMLRASNLDDPDFDEQKFLRMAPLGRYGTPEEIAKVALFLASDDSSFLNGAIIPADGATTITFFGA